jgi:hypothetical protein
MAPSNPSPSTHPPRPKPWAKAIAIIVKSCYICLHKFTIHPSKDAAMRSGMVNEEQGRTNIFAVEPKMYVTEEPQFGFNVKSELLNGRLAMIGFVSLLALEVLTGHGIIGFLANL